jgi:hypothetical protein
MQLQIVQPLEFCRPPASVITGGSGALLPHGPVGEGGVDDILDPTHTLVMTTATAGELDSAVPSSHCKAEDFHDEPLKKRGRLVNRSSRFGADASLDQHSARAVADENSCTPSPPVSHAQPSDINTPMAHATFLVPSDGSDHSSLEQHSNARISTPQQSIGDTAAQTVTAEAAASEWPVAPRRAALLSANTTISPPYKLTQLPAVPAPSVGRTAVATDNHGNTKTPSARWSFASFLPSGAAAAKLPLIKMPAAASQSASAKLRTIPCGADDVPAAVPAPSDGSACASGLARVTGPSPWGWKRPAASPTLDADVASRAVRVAARLFASSRVKSHSSLVLLQPINVRPRSLCAGLPVHAQSHRPSGPILRRGLSLGQCAAPVAARSTEPRSGAPTHSGCCGASTGRSEGRSDRVVYLLPLRIGSACAVGHT